LFQIRIRSKKNQSRKTKEQMNKKKVKKKKIWVERQTKANWQKLGRAADKWV